MKASKPKTRWAQLTADESERLRDIGQPLPKYSRIWEDHEGLSWAPADEVRAARSQHTSGEQHE
jgi:hypothetical protein